MKNLVKSALVVFTLSVIAIPASAGNRSVCPVNTQDTVIKKDTLVTPEKPVMWAQAEVTYTKIEVSALPETVVTAVATKYEGYAIEEASKGSDNTYKLVLKKEESYQTVIFNEAGELVNKTKEPVTENVAG